jgi:hypothetical protein
MNTRTIIAIVFGLAAFITVALPAVIVAALVHDNFLFALPLISGAFAAAWGAVLSPKPEDRRHFGYLRGFAVATLSYLCLAATYVPTRPFPFVQTFTSFLILTWGLFVFPGLAGSAAGVWFLRRFAHQPNGAVEKDAPEVAHPSR